MSDEGVKLVCDLIRDICGGAVTLLIIAWMFGVFDRKEG
jgi:hypothetical protein